MTIEQALKLFSLPPNYDANDLRKGYHSVVTKVHPDVYQGDAEKALRYTQLVNEAHDILKKDLLERERKAKLIAANVVDKLLSRYQGDTVFNNKAFLQETRETMISQLMETARKSSGNTQALVDKIASFEAILNSIIGVPTQGQMKSGARR
ncbi:MAG: J domain-containing protein [Bacilli bacterium]|nr:J domain-containing protein [Bacilli bacterium]